MNNQHYYNMFVEACGQTVRPELLKFKLDYFASLKSEAVYCPYTGELLTPDNADSEYTAPQTLDAIVRLFLKKHPLDYTKVQYAINAANRQTLADPALVALWAKFHWKRAKLRLISQSDIVSYEPNDRALTYRETLRAEMVASGWVSKGSPTVAKGKTA